MLNRLVLNRDQSRNLTLVGLWIIVLGLLVRSWNDSGLPTGPLTITQTLKTFFKSYGCGLVCLMVVAHKILETAQSLNFSLAQSLGLGLGLGLISKIMLPSLLVLLLYAATFATCITVF